MQILLHNCSRILCLIFPHTSHAYHNMTPLSYKIANFGENKNPMLTGLRSSIKANEKLTHRQHTHTHTHIHIF